MVNFARATGILGAFPPFTWPTILGEDRVILLGRSGSGKTLLAKALLETVRDAIICDTKRNENWADIAETVYGDKIFKVRRGRYHWVPDDSFLVDPAQINDFFFRFYRAGPRTLYVDELLDVAPRASSFPKALKILATRGRSAHVGLWTTTQRPYDIPMFALSEANHYFVFELALDRDQKRVEEITGGTRIDFSKISGNHGFYYIDRRGRPFGPSRLLLAGNP